MLQLLLAEQGGGRAQFDGQERDFAAPALLLLPPAVIHGFTFQPGTDGWVLSRPCPGRRSCWRRTRCPRRRCCCRWSPRRWLPTACRSASPSWRRNSPPTGPGGARRWRRSCGCCSSLWRGCAPGSRGRTPPPAPTRCTSPASAPWWSSGSTSRARSPTTRRRWAFPRSASPRSAAPPPGARRCKS
ncbi:hypothetical protein [Teichococcus aestuarii]